MQTPTPTNVWSGLSATQAVATGIPYIDPDSLQPNVDPAGHSYDKTNQETGIKKLAVEQLLAGVNGNVTLNAMAGVVSFNAGLQQLTLTDDRIEIDSLVVPFMQSDDATAKSCIVFTILAGSCIFKLNAAATGVTKVGFLVLRTK